MLRFNEKNEENGNFAYYYEIYNIIVKFLSI